MPKLTQMCIHRLIRLHWAPARVAEYTDSYREAVADVRFHLCTGRNGSRDTGAQSRAFHAGTGGSAHCVYDEGGCGISDGLKEDSVAIEMFYYFIAKFHEFLLLRLHSHASPSNVPTALFRRIAFEQISCLKPSQKLSLVLSTELGAVLSYFETSGPLGGTTAILSLSPKQILDVNKSLLSISPLTSRPAPCSSSKRQIGRTGRTHVLSRDRRRCRQRGRLYYERSGQ